MAEHALKDYCLWLVPSFAGDLADVLACLRSAEPGSPLFEPHITLLHPVPASLDVSTVAARVGRAVAAANIGSMLALNLEPATTGEHYYQSVLAPVVPTPPLLALRQAVEAVFEVHPPKYFPHLSLQYGDTAATRRQELATTANEMHWEKHVEIREVTVVDARGTTVDWKVVARVPLQ